MSDINDIIDVIITRETAKVTRVGFGTALVLDVNAAFVERVRVYTDIASIAVDFATTSQVYKLALILLGQELTPTQFLVGRRLSTGTQSQDITIAGTPIEGDVFTVVINNITFSFTALTTPTVTTVAAGLAAVIDANSALSAVSSVGVITVTASIAADSFVVNSSTTDSTGGTIAVAAITGTVVETLGDTLNAIDSENPDYYGLLLTKRGSTEDWDTDSIALAAEAEARSKLLAYSSNDPVSITSGTTDPFSVLQALSRDRSIGVYNEKADDYPEAGWFGLQLPKTAGTTNWKFKTISGATPSTLNGTAYNNLKTKSANFIESIKGLNIITSEGVVASGEFIDIIRGVDSTITEIQEDTFSLFTSVDKVPFTNPGMQQTAGPLRAVLIRKAQLGLYVESTLIITIPDVSDISNTDKANRLFQGTTFSIQLQGAINKTIFRGKVFP